MPHSKIKESIAQHPETGRLRGRLRRGGQACQRRSSSSLKYQGKKSVIEGLRRVSPPGLRRYVGATEIPRVRGGLGVAVVSTPEGVMTDTQAPARRISAASCFVTCGERCNGFRIRMHGVEHVPPVRLPALALTPLHQSQFDLCHELENNRLPFPPKVKVEVKGQQVLVEGPKGKLNFDIAAAHQPQGGERQRARQPRRATTRRPRRCMA